MVEHTSEKHGDSAIQSWLQEQTEEQVYTVTDVYGESFGISIRTVTIYRHKETGDYYIGDETEKSNTVVFKDEVNDVFSPGTYRLSLNGDVFSSFVKVAKPFDGDVYILDAEHRDMSNLYDKEKLKLLQELISK